MRNSHLNVEILNLDGGLKLVCRTSKGATVEYCGALVRAGSRDDGDNAFGLAHFVEHTIFKGTQKRSSWHIINRMERVGGELNAYTTKEETVVYTAAPRGNTARAMELIADLAISSRFPESELDKEREVVADEINSYLDTPSEAVYDDFEELIFAGTPLAHNILGNTKALATFDSEICRNYLHKWYTADNLVIFYNGPLSAARVLPIVQRSFGDLPKTAAQHQGSVDAKALMERNPFKQVKDIDTHQAHTVMGSVIEGLYGKRFPMAILTNILGGPGMNSLLNVQLREKRGLVYSVEASTSLFSDCGLFTIYFGCDKDDVAQCEDIVRKQLDDIARNPLPHRALAAAKKQYIGQLTVASDVRDSVAISSARAAMYYNRVLTPAETCAAIDAVTTEEISEAARQISNLSMLTLQ